MEIIQQIPIALSIQYSGQYIGGLTGSTFGIAALDGDILEQDIKCIFQFALKIQSSYNNFTLTALANIPFIIKDKRYIEYNDCFEIMKLGISFLKSVTNRSVYPSYETIEITEPTKASLDEILTPFLFDMNKEGFYRSK